MDETHPWERQTTDTDASWRAFHAFYLPQEPPRSVDAAFRAYRGYPEDSKKAANAYFRRWAQAKDTNGSPLPGVLSWQERAAAWDDHLAALDREKWGARRAALREQDWTLGQKLREHIESLLDELPKFIKHSEIEKDGVRVVAVELNATLTQISRALRDASDLQRLAAGEPTSHVDHKLTGGVGMTWLNELTELDDEELDARIDKLAAITRRLDQAAEGRPGLAAAGAQTAAGSAPSPAHSSGQSPE